MFKTILLRLLAINAIAGNNNIAVNASIESRHDHMDLIFGYVQHSVTIELNAQYSTLLGILIITQNRLYVIEK